MRQTMGNIIKKILYNLLIIVVISGYAFSAAHAADYGRKLSKAERQQLCDEIRTSTINSPERVKSVGGGIIPDSVLLSIFNTTKNISDASSFVLV